MGKRTNTAAWLPNQQRWQINVQKNGVRRSFTSSKPGRTGQREANAKADAWLDDGISNTRMLVEAAYPQWIGELKLTTSRSNWEPIQSRWNVWVRPVIGRRRVGDLTEQQLQAIINKGFAGGLSKKYLSNMCTDLTMFCKWLRLSKMSTLRPEELHVPKGARSKEKEILQPEDLRTLFEVDTTIDARTAKVLPGVPQCWLSEILKKSVLKSNVPRHSAIYGVFRTFTHCSADLD